MPARNVEIITYNTKGFFILLHIFIDADSCPVKQEVYRVAKRYQLCITLVANAWMRIPDEQRISLEIVTEGLDAADNWIVENIQPDDIVITADIPLANRCIKKHVYVISPNGKLFTENNIGDVVATRDLMTKLRRSGEITNGPPPLKKSNRSQFLQQLDNIIQLIKRKHHSKST